MGLWLVTDTPLTCKEMQGVSFPDHFLPAEKAGLGTRLERWRETGAGIVAESPHKLYCLCKFNVQ